MSFDWSDYDLTNIVLNNLPFTTEANLMWAKEVLERLRRIQKR